MCAFTYLKVHVRLAFVGIFQALVVHAFGKASIEAVNELVRIFGNPVNHLVDLIEGLLVGGV